MKSYTEAEIAKLQDNLMTIRKAGGWSAEEFGEMIGVTKQTISNLENKKTTMSKTQYIAIRAVLDYEIAEQPENAVLRSTVNLFLNSDNLSVEEIKTAKAFIEGASQNSLDSEALVGGLVALIGVVAAGAIVFSRSSSALIDSTKTWLSKLLK